jgi:UPF0755 protein
MKKTRRALVLIIILLVGVFYAIIKHGLTSPKTFENEKAIFRVEKEESVRSVSERLEEAGLIRSSLLLRLYLSWRNYDTKLAQGEFHFFSPLSLTDVARQLVQRPAKALFVVTVPEGSDDNEVVNFFTRTNTALNKEKLLSVIKERDSSGYLFPDTYFLSGKESEEEIIEKLLFNFKIKYSNTFLKGESYPTIKDMLMDKEIKRHLVIASILEGEAREEYDMRVIAGILLKREKIGMRLQVDVAMETYKEKGFPETPINNPGLIALSAVNNPVATDYLYYITGNDGNMYYAKTFPEHRKNILRYLK